MWEINVLLPSEWKSFSFLLRLVGCLREGMKDRERGALAALKLMQTKLVACCSRFYCFCKGNEQKSFIYFNRSHHH